MNIVPSIKKFRNLKVVAMSPNTSLEYEMITHQYKKHESARNVTLQIITELCYTLNELQKNIIQYLCSIYK